MKVFWGNTNVNTNVGSLGKGERMYETISRNKLLIKALLCIFCIFQLSAFQNANAQNTTDTTLQEHYPLIDINRLATYIGAPERLFVNVQIADEPTLGVPEAKLVMIEFSDFNCTSCARFHGSSLQDLIANYVDTGKMRFVYRDFVGVGGSLSLNAALAGNCLHDQIGTDAYFPLMNDLYGSSGRKTMNKFLELAIEQELEYVADDLLLCIEDKVFSPEVYDDINAAYAVGIRGTPAFILGYEASDGTVDGLLLLGAAPYDKFAALIDQFLVAQDVLSFTTHSLPEKLSSNY